MSDLLATRGQRIGFDSRVGWPQLVRRNPLRLLAPALVLIALAVGAGLTRAQTFTSRALLDVGGLNVNRASAAGYTIAVNVLTIQYARAIHSVAVAAAVQREVGVTRGDVVREVSATPVSNSPLIAVQATSQDRNRAIRLADAASASLLRYAVDLNSGRVAAQRLKGRYVSASRALQADTAALARLAPRTAAYRSTQVAIAVDQLQLQTWRQLYGQAQTGQTMANLMQRLSPALEPDSDRAAVLEQYIAIALVVGLLASAALTAFSGRRTARPQPM